MDSKSLKLLETDKTFFSKITTSISKMLIPTKIGLNGMLISLKRNAVVKAYHAYQALSDSDSADKKKAVTDKYESAYSLYLESIDKYIMDSVYKKVKGGIATQFEKDALSNYYVIINLKDSNYLEYKHKKQKYLIELDYETVKNSSKEKNVATFEELYISKMDSIYKALLKNYAVKLADNLSNKLDTKDDVFTKIFEIIEEYMEKILSLKIERESSDITEEIIELHDKYDVFSIGKLDEKDIVERKLIVLSLSRLVFTHSLPLAVAEQCYIYLLKEARSLIVKSKSKIKKEKMYGLLMEIIEDYNVKLLSTKIYWDKPEEKELYREFWDKYKIISEMKSKNLKKYLTQREILFLKNDLKMLYVSSNNKKNSKIIKAHKERLVEFGEMKQITDFVKPIEEKTYTKIKTKIA